MLWRGDFVCIQRGQHTLSRINVRGIDYMRIGLDGIPLLTPKTGVGRYTFELASALTRLSQPPELVFFYGRHWSKRLKATTVANIGESYETLRSAVSRLIPAVSKKCVRQNIFRIGLIGYRADLFHATNYVAFPFDGIVVVTVHDLSSFDTRRSILVNVLPGYPRACRAHYAGQGGLLPTRDSLKTGLSRCLRYREIASPWYFWE